ncbi:DUF4159 domain-containing protein [Stieleria sp. TO1_6]|uniref:DUF4159 domain-containing protein n=1 Tax=Stieleria tagensis TaxID=2956795 RepID=UPI00209A8DC7|nr:DUF4159 domain-containing protein [Stieleria tagensis]MCO8125356.1 DUF4159 domain-containing protein [Stieleria tagensis]
MNRRRIATVSVLLVATLLGLTSLTLAQWGRRGRARSIEEDRRGVPDWEVDRRFPGDLFTFARVRYDSYGRGGGWQTDYPDSDLNFSLRLQQLTTIKVNPDPVIVNLTDENLSDYPFLYMIEPGGIALSEPEVLALRRYCENGGFLMVDDFWGDTQYQDLAFELDRVFPNHRPFEVPLEHEIFHNVYDLKQKPQVPSINAAAGGVSYEWSRDGSDTTVPHYLAITDDKDRIMVFICHNTDLGDGWEREGQNEDYFREYSVKKAYPMGINIVTYAMTH